MVAVVVVGIILLCHYILTSGALPSLSEYIASSTAPMASTTPDTSPGTSSDISSTTTPATTLQTVPTLQIRAPKGTIQALEASTAEAMSLGLGERASLPTGQGMLFEFPHPGDYGFWMKDMRFPLDMVWISSDKRASGVTANIPADSYPTVFFPPLAISYVLELNAGQAAELGIATGTQLGF